MKTEEADPARTMAAFALGVRDGVRDYRAAAVAAWLLLALSLALNFYQAGSEKVQAFVVSVDGAGRTRIVGYGSEIEAADPRVVAGELGRFVMTLRSRSTDEVLQRREMGVGFAFLQGKASTWVDRRMSEEERELRGKYDGGAIKRLRRIVELASEPIKVPSGKDDEESSLWEVSWIETLDSADGQVFERTGLKGKFRVSVRPSSRSFDVRNPLGVRIEEAVWADETIAIPRRN